MLNHRPEDQGIWFDYNGWRYKDVYHVKLKDGRVVEHCRPNADAFLHGGEIIMDSDVDQIMLVPDDQLGKWNYKGESRIKRNLEMFGDAVPPKKSCTP